MRRKKYFISLMAVALFFLSSLTVFGQVTRGKIVLKKADGTTVPVVGAVIDIYRVDAKGKLPSGKTDKKGEFAFVGLTYGQTYAFAVSAPNISPAAFSNIKAGQEGITISVNEGDGKRFTEDEARQVINAPKTNTATPTSAVAPTEDNSPEAKKAQEEYQKQVSETTAKNERTKATIDIVNRALKEGKEAFDAGNFDLAITKFNEGINADPDFAGTAPVMLNNKALALLKRATNNYNQSVKADPAAKATAMESVKKDLFEAVSASDKSFQILKAATTTDANVQKGYAAQRYVALSNLVEAYRLLFQTRADQTKGKEALAAIEAYSTVETDAAKKLKAQMVIADALRLSGDSTDALPIYRKILETSPDNADAMGGLGLSLFNEGVSYRNMEQMQEGLNIMQRFTEIAPETHPLKTGVRDAVTYLKNNEKLLPQKTTTKTTTKKKS